MAPAPWDRYRFVLCNEYGEAFGDVGKATARKVSFQRNGVHSGEVSLDIEDALAYNIRPGLTRLKVFCSSVTTRPVFYGTLPATNAPWTAASGVWNLTFVDPRWRYANLFNAGTENYSQVDQGAILSALNDLQNARPGGDTFIRAGAIVTGTLRDRTYGDISDVTSLFSNMSEVIGGCDFDVIPFDGFADHGLTYGSIRVMGLLNVYPQQGNILPNAKFIYGPKLASNVLDMGGTNQPIVTQATAIGSTLDDGTILSSTYGDPASSPYGLMEDRESVPDAVLQSTLDDRARGIVEQSKILRPVLTISGLTRDAPQPFRSDGFYLGDTAFATCRKGAIQYADLPVRIDAFSVSPDAQGELDIEITVSTNA